jgi:predicted hydrolase (HD superfamily)
MAMTKAVPRDQLVEYFDEFTKRFLRDASPEAVDVEVLEPDWGEQVMAQGARLLGDHRIIEPAEVWAVEEEDGFISAVEVVHPDGAREVVSVKRVGLRHVD